jgi:hypothetical protein
MKEDTKYKRGILYKVSFLFYLVYLEFIEFSVLQQMFCV